MTHLRRNTVWSGTVLCLVALLLTPHLAFAAPQGPSLPLSLCAPAQNTFTLDINNPYFPLPVGQVWAYSGKEQGQTVQLQITVLDATETFHFGGGQNVTTRVVEEVEWTDTNANGVIDRPGELIEESLNYFAQTAQPAVSPGTVCYFGENVAIYENGVIVSNEGAWRADGRKGLPGTAPGIFMPSNPLETVGVTFQQEVAPGVAMDEATIVRTGSTVRVPAGTFSDAITVRDFNPLDGSRGTKLYAPNVGLVRDGPLDLISYSAPLNPNP
jgi:hypothetical protein